MTDGAAEPFALDAATPEQHQPTLIGCSSWSGPGRLCRYVWGDGLVEWFTEDMVHQKGRGLATRPE
jgi:hypothetical protein